ncbi:MAG: GNAT family N-acetyltransferase [Solirubrobacterales bacterium]|nr:GNAT family N-acetyltransferase [Solirubrobacterales bacterium]
MALRQDVFVAEQGVPLSLEVDDHDPIATHLVVVEDGRVVATTRLLDAGDVVKLGRLAVAHDARRRGLARLLLEESERRARAGSKAWIVLSAQTYARELYRAAGYVERGGPFMEAGIEHVVMELRLA